MKPAPFEYRAPRSLAEALDALAEGEGDAKVLAGGQSLIPLLNMRLASPRRLVDLNRVADLVYVCEQDGGYAIGAMTRQAAVERDERIRRDIPLLAEAIGHVGHPQIRNRGTLGGSIAHADPSAELPAVAVLLGARATVQGPRGTRTVPVSELYLGYLATTIEPDEILTDVWFPRIPESSGYAWVEFARRHGDFALAAVGVALTLDGDAVGEARIVAAGVGGAPVRTTAAEQVLDGRPLEPDCTSAAVDALRSAIEPDADVHSSSEYRRHLAGVLLERALKIAHARAREAVRA